MKILTASYGYDMTINNYYKIVKEGEKTVLVQKIGRIVSNDEGRGNGTSVPNEKVTDGEVFRAHVRGSERGTYYVSKYFPGGYADEWNGKPEYYNSWD